MAGTDIETRLFRYFVTLAQERHFSRAAELLDITPPTLSHQIKRLECQLGARLFERSGNTRTELTPAGQRLLQHARNVLHETEVARHVAQQAARGEIGRIDIGLMVTVTLTGLISRLIGGFRKANPAIEIDLQQMTTLQQIDAILNKTLDFGFVRPPEAWTANLAGFVVQSLPMLIALPSDHPLASKKRILPSELKSEPFINTPVDLDIGFRKQIDTLGSLGGFTPRVIKRVSNVISILSHVSAGQGIAIVSQGFARMEVPNVVFREFETDKPPMSEVAFVYRHDETSPAARSLIKYVKVHGRLKGSPS